MADLSGAWRGTYWQGKQPVRFEMTLILEGNTLLGRILDDNYLGEASLVGEVSGGTISFTKTYFISSRHSVYYMGKISEEGNKMQGRWRISSFFGRWEALRDDENLNLGKIIRRKDKVSISI